MDKNGKNSVFKQYMCIVATQDNFRYELPYKESKTNLYEWDVYYLLASRSKNAVLVMIDEQKKISLLKCRSRKSFFDRHYQPKLKLIAWIFSFKTFLCSRSSRTFAFGYIG